jgi:hypothetical protein
LQWEIDLGLLLDLPWDFQWEIDSGLQWEIESGLQMGLR